MTASAAGPLLSVRDLRIVFDGRRGPLTALDGEVSDRDRAFYTGKVAAAKFFASNVLPRLTAERAMLESTDLSLMELPEEAF